MVKKTILYSLPSVSFLQTYHVTGCDSAKENLLLRTLHFFQVKHLLNQQCFIVACDHILGILKLSFHDNYCLEVHALVVAQQIYSLQF